MLTHIGRNSGLERKVVLEVVAFNPEKKSYFVAAGWRGQADWFKNIQVNPSVTFTVGAQEFKATAQVVPVEEAAGIFHIYAFHHKQAFRELTRFMMGEALHPDNEGCLKLAQSVPLVRLLTL
jgi:deazaflavin-dependent oxidoreductase (nitroreductase family)